MIIFLLVMSILVNIVIAVLLFDRAERTLTHNVNAFKIFERETKALMNDHLNTMVLRLEAEVALALSKFRKEEHGKNITRSDLTAAVLDSLQYAQKEGVLERGTVQPDDADKHK